MALGADEKCFACGKKLGKHPKVVSTRDNQNVYVGSDCYKKIKLAGATGYKPKSFTNTTLRLYDDFKQ